MSLLFYTFHLNFIVMVLLTKCGACHLHSPTIEEIERGIVNKPKKCWGRQLQSEQSLRIVAIGGSNTSPSPEKKYPERLNELVSKFPKSYCHNQG